MSPVTIPVWLVALLVIVVVLAAAAITAGVLLARSGPAAEPVGGGAAYPQPAQRPTPVPAPLPAPVASGPAPADRALVEGLIGAHDLAVGSPAVTAHVEQVLRQAGVRILQATPGAEFDAATQLAIGTQAGGAEQAGRIVRQVRAGWRSDQQLLRPTEVIVWTR